MSEGDPFKRAPFAGQRTHLNRRVFEINGDTNRGIIVHAGKEFSYGRLNSDSTLEGLMQARALFQELDEKYGVKHAGFQPVVGEVGGEVGEYIVSAKIDGLPMASPDDVPIPEVAYASVRELLGRLGTYLDHKSKQSEPGLTDIFRLEQYVFKPDSQQLILVDVDPYFAEGASPMSAVKDMEPMAGAVLSPAELEEWGKQMAVPVSREMALVELDVAF